MKIEQIIFNTYFIKIIISVFLCLIISSYLLSDNFFELFFMIYDSSSTGYSHEILPGLFDETIFFELLMFSFVLIFNKKILLAIKSKFIKAEREINECDLLEDRVVKDEVLWVVKDFKSRAESLELRASLFMFLIIILLCSSVVLVIFAGRLTNLDATVGNKAEVAKFFVETAKRQYQWSLSELRESVSDYNAQYNHLKKLNRGVDAKLLHDENYGVNGFITHLEIDVAMEKKNYESAQNNLIKANESLLFEDTANINDLNFLYATAITRFGIMVIVFFFVKILLDFYKYNIRLSSYYKARADSLIIVGKYDKKFHKLLPALSPEPFDFEKAPKAPTEDFKTYTLQLLSTLKKDDVGKNHEPDSKNKG